jgi:multimeric flavodoxin WrbA
LKSEKDRRKNPSHQSNGDIMMKIMAFNGSPRKKWNTATLLKKALEGAASQGAKTELFHLYDLNFKGCISCFACKTKGGKSYGRCAVKDDLTPIFRKIEKADAVILGSPIYFGSVSGEMRSFMERLLFPYLTYTDPPQSLFPGKIKTGFIYTMNTTEKQMAERGYVQLFKSNEMVLRMIFGDSEYMCSFDTYQFDDYSKVVSTRFDPVKKARRREEVFPKDCEKAFEMGSQFAEGV